VQGDHAIVNFAFEGNHADEFNELEVPCLGATAVVSQDAVTFTDLDGGFLVAVIAEAADTLKITALTASPMSGTTVTRCSRSPTGPSRSGVPTSPTTNWCPRTAATRRRQPQPLGTNHPATRAARGPITAIPSEQRSPPYLLRITANGGQPSTAPRAELHGNELIAVVGLPAGAFARVPLELLASERLP
jgi:hypothetical protein